MADILQWEFAESFTAVEAALLIEGKKPSDCGHDGRDEFGNLIVSEVILARMKSDYDTTWHGFAFEAPEYWPVTLPSEMMNIMVKNLTMHHGKASFMKWLLDNEEANFQAQRFTREDIQLWLNKGQLPSKYQFKNIADLATDVPLEKHELHRAGRWPWGDHHTELLGHLEATACRYWKNYDSKDATTAPINKDVAEWLVTERKLSQKMADSIASILRQDGLPTGPRK